MTFPIHDLIIRQLDSYGIENATRIPAYRFDDHILRQLRYAEFVQLPPGIEGKMAPQAVADELWALVDGEITFTWVDMRPESPSFKTEFELPSDTPVVILVPFGVEFGYVSGAQGASLIRFSSHQSEASLQAGELSSRRQE